MTEQSGIGKFSTEHPLQLKSAPNGGWVVYQQDPLCRSEPQTLGAYTTAGEMLAALGSALSHYPSTSEEPKDNQPLSGKERAHG